MTPLAHRPASWAVLRAAMHATDAERAHAVAVAGLSWAGRSAPLRAMLQATMGPRVGDPVEVMGLRFANRVGLAAGWDKDARAWPGLATMGFGHVEVGTITPRPQPGNPKPRVFRLVEDEAVINRMGFPGAGMAAAAAHLTASSDPALKPPGFVLGVNIGRNKATSNEDAAADACAVLDGLGSFADYVAINVSSPNTPGLRALQRAEELQGLLAAVAAHRDRMVAVVGRSIPLAVKIAPDLDAPGIDGAVDAAIAAGMAGLIATNTTLARDGLQSGLAGEQGGLSGKPLAERSLQVLDAVVARAAGRLAILSVGGVHDADQARQRIERGADLVQVYSGLVYAGPALVRQAAIGAASGAQRR